MRRKQQTKLVKWLDAHLYPQFADHWDDELFNREIEQILRPDHSVLDLGAGRGILPQMNFKGRVRKVFGADRDREIAHNPHLDHACLGNIESLPYHDKTFDIVLANNVLEHLANPELVFRDVARVLKPGGYFLAKTANRDHYVPLIARHTSHQFHEWVNRQRGREEIDTFPTFYSANSPRDIERLAGSGLIIEKFRQIEGRPEYCRFSGFLYLAGATYERIVNALPIFSRFRILMILVLRKA